mgnify:CR=1 FL=1
MEEHIMMTISKRAIIRAVCFLVAGILVCTGALVQSYRAEEQFRTQVEYEYQYALSDLSDSLSSLSVTLEKSRYASTPAQISGLSAKLWKEAGIAKNCLSRLPVSDFHLQNTNRFLSQVGEYSMTLSKKVIGDGEITQEERDTLVTLGEYAKQMNDSVTQMKSDLDAGITDLEQLLTAEVEEDSSTQVANLSGFAELEDDFVSYPSLIYDGPFSDHLLQREPLVLKDKAEISKEEAKEIAAKAFGIEDASQIMEESEEEGIMPAYRFVYGPEEAAVSKRGGYLIYKICSKEHGEQRYSVDHAVQIGARFLSSMGLSGMKNTYYEISNGVCTINFASIEGEATCYTDLIKVSVCLDEGKVCGYDARGYLTNHKARNLEQPKLTSGEAAAILSSELSVKNYQMAVIPTDGLNEAYCYEFLCEGSGGENVLVYIDTQTGEEERILILVEDESGTLTL